ncbi:AAA family ATPase [Maritimibacter sp. DP07]|uniref:AAA family ATPase n=1 Tax=Maritimibacter harenae TaxID=2606218 RepID=A0A845MB36_9RHOB|nr:AAA family ATPase [Maritimibacter harenae]MZR14251.1 AAA family ATPase [Maritimibacter harenae]
MNIRFIPVTDIHDPLTLSIGLSGGSGTGKTYSALLIARGIAETVTGRLGAPIGYVDTENRRALHYKQAFPEMMHFDFQAVDDRGDVVGFGPERWIEVIDAAEDANLPVVILDSFSHAWEGVGGVLDLHATTLERLTGGNNQLADKRSQLAWAEVKPRYRRLIDRIVRAKTNIIICTRAKPVMQDFKTGQNARKTKTRRPDVPWDPAADGDLMFEMTTMVILDPAAPGCPVHQIKVADQFKGLLDPKRPLGIETGRAMAEWAHGQGDAQAQKDILDKARNEARKGKNAFTAFWNSDEGKQHRPLLRNVLEECQRLASDADTAEKLDDDPFQDDTPEPDAEQFSALAATIKRELANADPGRVGEVMELYGPQIEQMKTVAPHSHAELHAEIEKIHMTHEERA